MKMSLSTGCCDCVGLCVRVSACVGVSACLCVCLCVCVSLCVFASGQAMCLVISCVVKRVRSVLMGGDAGDGSAEAQLRWQQ